jgi:hypothetical protein
VAEAFGFTVPVAMAEVGWVVVTAPVVTEGGAAAEAANAVNESAVATATVAIALFERNAESVLTGSLCPIVASS